MQCVLQTPVEVRDLIRLGGLLSHLQKESPLHIESFPSLTQKVCFFFCSFAFSFMFVDRKRRLGR